NCRAPVPGVFFEVKSEARGFIESLCMFVALDEFKTYIVTIADMLQRSVHECKTNSLALRFRKNVDLPNHCFAFKLPQSQSTQYLFADACHEGQVFFNGLPYRFFRPPGIQIS